MNATDMTKGKPMKLLFLFSLPLMFGNVFQQLYTVVDTMIVGQTLGVSALAALGAAESLGWMSLGSIQGLTQGFSICMAQQFGAKDEDGLHQAVGHSIVLSALLAVLLTIVFQAAVCPVLAILQTPEDIKPDTILYLRILFTGIPIVVAYNLLLYDNIEEGRLFLNGFSSKEFETHDIAFPFCAIYTLRTLSTTE